jgi:hypothetical protein
MVYIMFKHFELPATETFLPHVTWHCLVGGTGGGLGPSSTETYCQENLLLKYLFASSWTANNLRTKGYKFITMSAST